MNNFRELLEATMMERPSGNFDPAMRIPPQVKLSQVYSEISKLARKNKMSPVDFVSMLYVNREMLPESVEEEE